MSQRSIIWLICILGLATGCSAARLSPGASAPSAYATLESGQTVGQTFVAGYNGLAGLKVYLRSTMAGGTALVVHLRADPGSATDLAVGRLSLDTAKAAGFYTVPFAPQADSSKRYYYARVELEGAGQVELGEAGGGSYLDGALYQSDQPQDAQLVFQPVYAPVPVGVDVSLKALTWAGYLALGLLLFVLPGWALLDGLWPAGELSWAERLGIAAGLGVGVYPLLMLWTNKAGWAWGSSTVWAVVLLSSLWLAWRSRPWQWRVWRWRSKLAEWGRSSALWPDVTWLLLVVMVGATRFWQAAWLDLPLWHDSVSHSVVAQRLLESGGLFTSWLPYAPYQTLSTQFGFHADVASWAWLTGMGTAQSIIVSGQILNVLAVLALYPLGYRLCGRWAGSLTVLAAGLLSPLPGYYTNWGRYPQLVGQIGLPVAAWWLWMMMRHDKARGWEWVIGGLVVGGMVLAYYRMVFYYLAFGAAVLLVILATEPRRLFKWKLWLILIGAAVLAGVGVLPWLGKVLTSRGEGPALASGAVVWWARVQQVFVGWPPWAVGLWLVGWPAVAATLILGGPVLKRRRELEAALPLIWLLCLASLPLLRLAPLPGVSILEAFSILISAYLPLALAAGVGVAYGIQMLAASPRWSPKFAGALAAVVAGVGMLSTPWQATLIDRDYDLSTRPDLRAAAWINLHLSADAFFLINGLAYDLYGTSLAGDAGSWLPLLTGRGAVIPVHYAFLEKPDLPGYSQALNQLVRKLVSAGPASREGLAVICAFPQPITHVYLGQRQGRVFRMLPPVMHVAQPLLPPQVLLSSPAFRLIYHQDRVYIFELDRAVCP